jgi:multimeric flavodoxin WrbA
MKIRALGLNGSLKRTPTPSSTQKLLDEVLDGLRHYEVETSSIRLADLEIPPGVTVDEGEGDAWPAVRQKILDSHILVLATPIWVGQPSSLIKRALERMDAFLGEIDDDGYYPTFGKVGVAVVVGNEDGAHHVTAELYQALTDFGFTIPGGSSAYWVGEAMGSTNYLELENRSEKLQQTIRTLARNAAHLAGTLVCSPYPRLHGEGTSVDDEAHLVAAHY